MKITKLVNCKDSYRNSYVSSYKERNLTFKFYRGISLIEIMIGMAVGLIILAAGTKLIYDAGNLHRIRTEIQRMRNDASFAFNDMKRSVSAAGAPTFCPNKSLTMGQKADYATQGDSGQLFDYINESGGYSISKNSRLLGAFDTMPGIMAYDYQAGGSFIPKIPSEIFNLFNPKPVSDVLVLGFYDFNPSFAFKDQNNKQFSFNNAIVQTGVINPPGVTPLPNGVIDIAPHALSIDTSSNAYNLMRFDDCSSVSTNDKTYIFLAKAATDGNIATFDVSSSYSGKPWNSQENGPVNWDTATPDEVAIARKYQFAYIKKVVYYVGLDPNNNNVRTLYRGDIFNYLPSGFSQVIRVQAIARNVDRFELLYNVSVDNAGTLNWLSASDPRFYITRTNGMKVSMSLSSPFVNSDDVKSYTMFAGASKASGASQAVVVTPSDKKLNQVYETTWALNNRL